MHLKYMLKRDDYKLSCTCVRAEPPSAPSRPTITASSISIGRPSIVIGSCSQKKIHLPKQKRLPHAIADADVRKLLALTTNPIHHRTIHAAPRPPPDRPRYCPEPCS
jgi:hypothetical protein